ncbi:MAG TPA: winged helix-turn-helix transcriptional regulator [Methanocorpusculum sp.]|nr:winged helix-turn-helix transcriptional regulator [Methanocorpusculum sp.]
MPEADSQNTLNLYLRDGSITTIRNPVRLKIIYLIQRKGSVTFQEILDETGLSKSTVSVYVNTLADAGIITRVSDNNDRRKKTYVMTAKYIGSIVPSTYSATSEFRDLIKNTYTNYDKINYKAMLPHLFRIALAESGIHINPVIRRGGIILGQSITPFIAAETLEKTVDNLSEFWSRYEFGDLSLKSKSPLVIEVKNCYECMTLPKGIAGGCIISEGVLEAVFSAVYPEGVSVHETECIANGDPACMFEITVNAPAKAE